MRRLWIAVACALLAACDSKVSVDLSVADGDEIDSLRLHVAGVALLDDDGSSHSLDSDADQPLELADLVDGETITLIDNAKIDASAYDGLALRLAGDGDDTIERDDEAEASLTADTLLNFADLDLDLADEETAELVAVLDLRFSLSRDDAGEYTLHPWIRVVQAERAASISGRIDGDDVTSSGCRQGREAGIGVAVYAFEKGIDEPVDFDRSREGPVASAPVRQSGTIWYYDIPYLSPGSYVLAWTCSGDADSPDSDDGITFSSTRSVTVDEAEAATVDW